MILVASLAHAINALKRSLALALPLFRREVAKIGLSVPALARFARQKVEIGKELRQDWHHISIAWTNTSAPGTPAEDPQPAKRRRMVTIVTW